MTRRDDEPATIGDLRLSDEWVSANHRWLWLVSVTSWIAILAICIALLAGKAGAQEHRGPSGPNLVNVEVPILPAMDADAIDAGATQIRRAVEALADKGLVSTVMTVHPQAVQVTLTSEPGTVTAPVSIGEGATITLVLDPVESTRVLAPILDHLRADMVAVAEDTRDEVTTALLGDGGILSQAQDAQVATADSVGRIATAIESAVSVGEGLAPVIAWAVAVAVVLIGLAFVLAGLGILVWLARRG